MGNAVRSESATTHRHTDTHGRLAENHATHYIWVTHLVVPYPAPEIPVFEELTSAQHIIINDNFLPSEDAAALRGVFDQRFADPRAIHPERFLWDYWHGGKARGRRRLQGHMDVTAGDGGGSVMHKCRVGWL